MSGICGIYHLDNRAVDRSLLERMLECVPRGGMDAVRVWTGRSIALGHRQFRTTEESLREVQPAANREETCRVTFDGRVDNREDLIHRLNPSVGGLDNPTDVELFLHAYDVWGVDCLKWVIGDFAFALWDNKRQQLFCGRDTYGIRPFYYYFDRLKFLFASDCLQLAQDPAVPLTVDRDKIAEWFTWCGILSHTYRDQGKSFFQNVHEIPSGHYLVVNAEGRKLQRYWDAVSAKEIRYRRTEDYAGHFLSLMREAVRCRLRSSNPVGAELSGGFDSSAIVCLAAEILGQNSIGDHRLATFSLVFDELSCDERPLIHSVVDKYRLPAHQLPADKLCRLVGFQNAAELDLDINSPDQPHSLLALQALYEVAYESGIRVMLSGEGAEQHVLGNRFVVDSLIHHGEWRDLLRRMLVMMRDGSPRSLLVETVKFGLAPLLVSRSGESCYHRWFHPEFYDPRVPEILTSNFRAHVLSALANQKQRLLHFPRFKELGKQLAYEGLTPAAPMLCKDISTRVMIERRFPYHDRRLIEFCLAIPPEKKFEHLKQTQKRNIRGRALQRHAFKTILPQEILQSKTKVNFNDISRRRMLELKSAYVAYFDAPSRSQVSELEIVDDEKLSQMISDFFLKLETQGRMDPYAYMWINRVTQLEIWLQSVSRLRHERTSRPSERLAAAG